MVIQGGYKMWNKFLNKIVENKIIYFLQNFNKEQWAILISLLILSIIIGN